MMSACAKPSLTASGQKSPGNTSWGKMSAIKSGPCNHASNSIGALGPDPLTLMLLLKQMPCEQCVPCAPFPCAIVGLPIICML